MQQNMLSWRLRHDFRDWLGKSDINNWQTNLQKVVNLARVHHADHPLPHHHQLQIGRDSDAGTHSAAVRQAKHIAPLAAFALSGTRPDLAEFRPRNETERACGSLTRTRAASTTVSSGDTGYGCRNT